jgi:hypothetical protein
LNPERIIRIAAVAGALFLWEGCARIAVPEPDGKDVIGFAPGAQLLKDDVPTKAGTFKEGEFGIGDKVAVFGRRYGNSQTTDVFNGTLVEKTGASAWTYSPLQAWYWLTEGDYYDFLGVYPTGKGTSRIDVPGNLAIQTHYSVTNSNYDLMYALYRRYGNESDRISAVPLNFKHALSAVRIIFDNESNTQDITVNSYEFTHMVVDAYAKATMDGVGNPEILWINTVRNSSPVRHVDPETLLKGKSLTGSHSYTGLYDFLIPTALTATSNGSADEEEYMPHLVVRYTPTGQSTKEANILLKSIQRDPLNGDYTPVEVWEPGVKYTYHIKIRMDGGVQIYVITTEWENVYAETPGVMID